MSASLDIENETYSKIENGDLRAKREQIFKIDEILLANPEELIIPWLVDKIIWYLWIIMK